MASVRALVTIKREGEYHPPGSILRGFSEAEIAGLKGYVVRVEGEEPEDDTIELSGQENGSEGNSEPEGDGEGSSEGSEQEPSRVEQIVAALDLLEEGDFFKNGKPKIGPLADALGWKPTEEEIDVAIQVKEAL